MQNSEWLKRFSIFVIVIILLVFLYGFLNLQVMNLENKKKEFKNELSSLIEERFNLEFKIEEATEPYTLMKRAIEELKMEKAEVIFINAGSREKLQDTGE